MSSLSYFFSYASTSAFLLLTASGAGKQSRETATMPTLIFGMFDNILCSSLIKRYVYGYEYLQLFMSRIPACSAAFHLIIRPSDFLRQVPSDFLPAVRPPDVPAAIC